MTQKETANWNVHFNAMIKHYRELAWQSHKKSETVSLRECKKIKEISVPKSTQVEWMRVVPKDRARVHMLWYKPCY